MIRASDIEKITDRRREVRKDTYTKLYEQFSRKIRQTVEFGQNQVFLTVPGFVLGYPTFDRKLAADYLKRQLERGQFEVARVDLYTFYVSWGNHKKSQAPPPVEPDDGPDDFPTLVNLKKAANKYRKNFH
jgi:hypothetical protein